MEFCFNASLSRTLKQTSRADCCSLAPAYPTDGVLGHACVPSDAAMGSPPLFNRLYEVWNIVVQIVEPVADVGKLPEKVAVHQELDLEAYRQHKRLIAELRDVLASLLSPGTLWYLLRMDHAATSNHPP